MNLNFFQIPALRLRSLTPLFSSSSNYGSRPPNTVRLLSTAVLPSLREAAKSAQRALPLTRTAESSQRYFCSNVGVHRTPAEIVRL
jgi:hypothetical protein